jgi:hypothetical protein
MESKIAKDLSKTLTPARYEQYFHTNHHNPIMWFVIPRSHVRFNPTGRRKTVTGGIDSIYSKGRVYLEHRYLKFFTVWIPEHAIITVKEEQVEIDTA